MSLVSESSLDVSSRGGAAGSQLPQGVLARLALINGFDVYSKKLSPAYMISVGTAKELGIEVQGPITLNIRSDDALKGIITERVRYFDITQENKAHIIEILKSAKIVDSQFSDYKNVAVNYYNLINQLQEQYKEPNKIAKPEISAELTESISKTISARQKAWDLNNGFVELQRNRGIFLSNCIFSMTEPKNRALASLVLTNKEEVVNNAGRPRHYTIAPKYTLSVPMAEGLDIQIKEPITIHTRETEDSANGLLTDRVRWFTVTVENQEYIKEVLGAMRLLQQY